MCNLKAKSEEKISAAKGGRVTSILLRRGHECYRPNIKTLSELVTFPHWV